jgi:O-methyltransferase involved in polyketide biosynthesis
VLSKYINENISKAIDTGSKQIITVGCGYKIFEKIFL